MALTQGAPAQAQDHQAYRFWRGQLVVEDAAHWRTWDGVAAALRIDDDGTVRPRFLRRSINAARNAAEFIATPGPWDYRGRGGIRRVGAGNFTEAIPILDGDAETWWEPSIRSFSPERIWVEVDLGRGVIADSITVRFAEDGDPFLKFRVLASDGVENFGSGRDARYFTVGQEAVPNKTRRVYTFAVPEQYARGAGVAGEAVRFVRVEMLATDGPRGREVTGMEYQRLSARERGAIDHYLRSVTGRLIRVVQATYEELPDEERGPVRHYAWERPRLAEVEVHAKGDNIVAMTQRPLYDEGDFFDDIARRFITDGFFSTGYTLRAYDPFRDRNQVRVDLGARFWLESLRLVSHRRPATSYQFRVSDGSLSPTGDYDWDNLPERLNPAALLQVEERFAPRPVRLIELRRLELLPGTQQGEITELEAFGEGYVSDLTLTSPVIDLGRRHAFGAVRWAGEAPPGTAVDVRSRTGESFDEVVTYHDRSGRQVSRAKYDQLRDTEKGAIQTKAVPDETWSPWSAAYPDSATPFVSPMPRLYTQMQVRLRTSEPGRAALVRRLSLDVEAPLVDRAVGEVWPVTGVRPGAWSPYELYVSLRPRAGDRGVQSLRVATTSSTPMRLHAVVAGDDAQLRAGRGDTLWPGSAVLRTLDDGRVEVTFAELLGDAPTQLRLSLEAKLFLPGTAFRVELRNSSRPGLVQRVDAGSATQLIASGSLTVSADLHDAAILAGLQLEPRVITPNGDGVNDVLEVAVTVYQLTGAHTIGVGVYDLAGRRVCDLSVRRDRPSGEHHMRWDGRDGGGALVPPGTYVVAADVDTDRYGPLRRVAVVAVAY